MHEAFEHAATAYLAFENQPRAQGEVAGRLEAEWDRCHGIVDAIVDELTDRLVQGDEEIDRLSFLARIAIRREDLTGACAMAARAAVLKADGWARFAKERGISVLA